LSSRARDVTVPPPDRSSVGGLATPHLRENQIDELCLDVHVHDELLKARMLMKKTCPGLINDFEILLRGRPDRRYGALIGDLSVPCSLTESRHQVSFNA
jgi:hypothetical protein